MTTTATMDHLDQLEAKSVHIFREAYANFKNLAIFIGVVSKRQKSAGDEMIFSNSASFCSTACLCASYAAVGKRSAPDAAPCTRHRHRRPAERGQRRHGL